FLDVVSEGGITLDEMLGVPVLAATGTV
ncbi:MAG: hypothetical protein QOI60_580, partial [Actinomycetota bacterium]|nr:hypothetical protein [Actinomycetota bacterium]